MIKITSSDKTIRLISDYGLFEPGTATLFLKVSSEKELEEAYRILMQHREVKEVFFLNENPEFLLNGFKSMFKVIEAAGGLVKNSRGEYLFIFRNGKWDLPKGKIEKDEPIKTAAVREVEEECGISGLEIISEITPTYHVYSMDGQKILKPTYWFKMTGKEDSVLAPQLEEGITEVKWIAVKDFDIVRKNTYESILDIINKEV